MISVKLKVKRFFKDRKSLDSWLNQRKYVYHINSNPTRKYRLNKGEFQCYSPNEKKWFRVFDVSDRELRNSAFYGLK